MNLFEIGQQDGIRNIRRDNIAFKTMEDLGEYTAGHDSMREVQDVIRQGVRPIPPMIVHWSVYILRCPFCERWKYYRPHDTPTCGKRWINCDVPVDTVVIDSTCDTCKKFH